VLDQRPTHANTLVIWFDARLLDVRVPVDNIDEHVADRETHVVDGDPAPPGARVTGQAFHRGRLVIGDVG